MVWQLKDELGLVPRPSCTLSMDPAMTLRGVTEKLRMEVHFLPMMPCEVLKQPSCSESRKCTSLLNFAVTPLHVMDGSIERVHEGLGTSFNTSSHAR